MDHCQEIWLSACACHSSDVDQCVNWELCHFNVGDILLQYEFKTKNNLLYKNLSVNFPWNYHTKDGCSYNKDEEKKGNESQNWASGEANDDCEEDAKDTLEQRGAFGPTNVLDKGSILGQQAGDRPSAYERELKPLYVLTQEGLKKFLS